VSAAYRIEMVTVDGGPTALGSAGPLSLVADRPVAACVSNDVYREASTLGIVIRRVAIAVDGDFPARGAPSGPIEVTVAIDADADDAAIDALLAEVDRVAEIPNSLRGTIPVTIRRVRP